MALTGLDIGSTAVRAVELSPPDSAGLAEIRKAAVVPLSPEAMRGGQVIDEALVAQACSDAVKAAGISPTGIAVATASQNSGVRWVDVPTAVKPSEWRDYVIAEGQRIAPSVALEQSAITLCPLPDALEGKIRLAAAATSAKDLAKLEGALKAAGIKPRSIDFSAACLLRALVRVEEGSTEVATIIDIGDRQTTVVTRVGAAVRTMRTFPQGSADITRAIIQATRCTSEEAEARKRSLAVGGAGGPGGGRLASLYDSEGALANQGPSTLLEEAVDIAADSIISSIVSTVESDEIGLARRGTQGIILSGGGALMRGMGARLQEQLQIPTQIGKPWATMDDKVLASLVPDAPAGRTEQAKARKIVELTVALGAALWSPVR